MSSKKPGARSQNAPAFSAWRTLWLIVGLWTLLLNTFQRRQFDLSMEFGHFSRTQTKTGG